MIFVLDKRPMSHISISMIHLFFVFVLYKIPKKIRSRYAAMMMAMEGCHLAGASSASTKRHVTSAQGKDVAMSLLIFLISRGIE